ncbi:hypothetical protein BCR42DRAFT_194607 [Absidia repens]|uniref:Uncharacterized protein n=1 Tax=Absidia repens TaxID=90262 RepID=A0A1X2ISQ1_9FUNG|nr:hypothetical protein BCR42DRAFT_194607 [Absidia repens]
MDASARSDHTDQSKKRGNSTSPDLQAMHDYTNNSYHSSFYRHQVQTRQQNDRSARTHTTSNKTVLCHSPAQALKGSLSPTTLSPLAVPAVVPSQQNSALSYHSHIESDIDAVTVGGHDIDDAHYSNNSIDFKILYDAMISSACTSSIDTSATHLHQYDAQDSLSTMLYYLNDCNNADQPFDAMDHTEHISFLRVMYLGIASSEELRLFLKKLSDGLSETLLHHTNSILSTDDSITSISPRSCRFHERKHRLLPLDLFLASTMRDRNNDDDDVGDLSYTTKSEDNVISIVEADFTTDNNDSFMKPLIRHDPELVLHYIHTHCQQNRPSSTLQAILNPTCWADQHAFTGSESSGIDLCVYFYHDAQDMAQVSEDMGLLWKIGALGIPILPIMSMSQQIPPRSRSPAHSSTKHPVPLSPNSQLLNRSTTTTSTLASQDRPLDDYEMKVEEGKDTVNTKAPYLTQRPIGVRRNELAYLFSLWRIKMMDISNLDVVGQPSFQSKGKSRWDSTDEDMMIERLLGQTWASSSLISPTPYHVLTLNQFMAIDRRAISNLLMAIKDEAKDKRQNVDDDDDNGSATTMKDNHLTLHANSTSSSLSTPKTCTSTVPVQKESRSLTLHATSHPFTSYRSKYPTLDRLNGLIVYIYPALFVLLLVYGLWTVLSLVVQYRQASTWRASLIMVSHRSGKSMAFIVNVYNGQDQPKWAPEPPFIATNIPLPTTTPLTSSSSSSCTVCRTKASSYSSIWVDDDPSSHLAPMTVMPLPNKTRQQSLEGQYFYSMPLPLCSSLDTSVDYYVQVKPSVVFPSTTKPGIVQGSPLHIPKLVLCGSSRNSAMVGAGFSLSWMDPAQENHNIMEAWHHFRQHSRFYLMNSIKIVAMVFTEGKEKELD